MRRPLVEAIMWPSNRNQVSEFFFRLTDSINDEFRPSDTLDGVKARTRIAEGLPLPTSRRLVPGHGHLRIRPGIQQFRNTWKESVASLGSTQTQMGTRKNRLSQVH